MMEKEHNLQHLSSGFKNHNLNRSYEPLDEREERLLHNLIRAHREIFGY